MTLQSVMNQKTEKLKDTFRKFSKTSIKDPLETKTTQLKNKNINGKQLTLKSARHFSLCITKQVKCSR